MGKRSDNDIKEGITLGKISGFITFVFWGIVIVAIIFAGVSIKNHFSKKKGIKLVTETNEITSIQEQLKKVLDIDNLYTSESIQSNVLEKKSGKKIDYTVKYDGVVKACIKSNNIQININDDKKLIMITVPKVEIIEYNVIAGSMEYLNDTSSFDADKIREKCEEDLLEKTDEHRLIDIARDNIRNSIKTLAELELKNENYSEYADYTINLYNSY